MLTIEKLRAYGANVDEGMGRCMNNEAFYLRLVNMAADDGGFEKLRAAMDTGLQAGFRADGTAAVGDGECGGRRSSPGGNPCPERKAA